MSLGSQLGFWRCTFHSCLCCTTLSKCSAVRIYKHLALTGRAWSSRCAGLVKCTMMEGQILVGDLDIYHYFCQPENCCLRTVWLSALPKWKLHYSCPEPGFPYVSVTSEASLQILYWGICKGKTQAFEAVSLVS